MLRSRPSSHLLSPFPFPAPSASCPAGSLVSVVPALSCLLVVQLSGTLPSLVPATCFSLAPPGAHGVPRAPLRVRLELLGSKIPQSGETSAAGFAVSIASKPGDRHSREAGPGDCTSARWAAPAAPSTRRATAAGSAAEVSKGPTPHTLRLGDSVCNPGSTSPAGGKLLPGGGTEVCPSGCTCCRTRGQKLGDALPGEGTWL